MAETQSNTAPEAAASRRTERRNGEDETKLAGREPRTFAPEESPKGVANEARQMSRTMTETTRELSQQAQESLRETANQWSGAVEPFMALQMEMNRWFNDLWRQTGLGGLSALRTARPFGSLSMAPILGLPAIDVKETDGAYLICAELPGLAREDVNLQVRGDALLISGQKTEQRDDAASTYRVSERRFGHFERTCPIPHDVDRTAIDASFRDGLLTVTLPKTKQAASGGEKIPIKA